MIPFINIHTHHTGVNQNHISIIDWFTAPEAQRNNLSLFSAGIHPWFIDELHPDKQYQEFKDQAVKPNCKAIGECGLDKLKGPAMDVQISLFEKQIAFAVQVKKPVIVHCVQAFNILQAIIKKHQNQTNFIIHGFNQNEQIAAQLIKQNAYLSFGSALMNIKNERLKQIFLQTPEHHIFIENDDASCAIEEVYEVAASIKKFELTTMKEIIFGNYKTVFNHE